MSFEDLTFIKLIGRGISGDVFLTLKKNENMYYATKIIKSSYFKNPKGYKYLCDEINILKDLNHPNILKYIEHRKTKEKMYIITEYYNGGTLGDFLYNYQRIYNNKNLSEEIVQYIMRQIVEGMKYIHNKKIIHRDICPDNIMLHYEDENDRINKNIMKAKIKIIDFGFAKYLKKGELTTSILCTSNYMDPIILFRLNNILEYKDYGYDEKVDIWSLGIIFYELLTGNIPFVAIRMTELVEKVKKGDYYVPGTISNEAFSFLTSMLEYDPKKRESIDILYNHEFLRKNVNEFTNLNKYYDKREIKINIKGFNNI